MAAISSSAKGDDTAGIEPPGYRLPSETRPGTVTLQVTDLDRSIGFYRDVIGFRVVDERGPEATLAAAGSDDPLLMLVEDRTAHPIAPRTRLGLFHFAVLLPSRADFGRLLRHLGMRGLQLGASDHGVSEAIYLSDPDGLSLEVYRDRPRDEWRRRGAEISMITEALDAEAAMAAGEEGPWRGLPAGTRIGHMHLHVGSLDEATAFYHEGLGLDKVVWSYPGALFLSAGGYHHHLGVNTWAGAAPPPGEDEARLLEWTLVVPDATVVDGVADSLEGQGREVVREDGSVVATDPWRTTLRVVQGE